MKDFEEIRNLLKVEGRVCEGRELSTFKGGGRAFVYMPKNEGEFVKIYSALKEENKGIYILGGGSNTIVKDGICKSAIISTRGLDNVEVVGKSVICECGASVAKVTRVAREHGLGGLEFLSGVPCSVGGAIRMNAGAFSSQTNDYIDEITILNGDYENSRRFGIGETSSKIESKNNVERMNTNEDYEKLNHVERVKINGDDRVYGYRNGEKNIVLSAVLKLREMPIEESVALSKKYVDERRRKQPSLPSVGSVFKNGEVASGMLIEKCGLKGVRIGGAQISQKHANFIVNVGGGSASDFLALVDICKHRVFDEFGVILHEEFEIVD